MSEGQEPSGDRCGSVVLDDVGTRAGAWPRGDEVAAQLIDAVILAIGILPLLLTSHLPLSDLPDHLARQYILRDWSSSAAFQQFYSFDWTVVPNLGLELFVAAARQVLSIDAAVRVFCITILGLIFVGIRLINMQLGGPSSRVYRVAPLLFYSGPFQFGFVSYCFGIGLALVGFGLYLRFLHWRLAAFAALFVPLGCALLLCHLAAFGLYAIAIASHAFACSIHRFDRRAMLGFVADLMVREGRVACYLLPPLVLFMALSPTAGVYAFRWSSLQDKAEGIAALTLFSSPAIELPLLGLAIIGFGAAIAIGALRLHRDAVPMLLGMAIVYLALPRSLLGSGYVDYRIPSGAACFLVACLVPGPNAARLLPLFAVWLSALGIVRVASIAWMWLLWEPTLSEFDAAFQRLPVGARLMVVQGILASTSESRRPSLEHIAALAVARRQVFDPFLYANISGHLLKFQPEFARFRPSHPPDHLDELDPAYDHVLVIHPELAWLSPRLRLTRIAQGRVFELFQVQRPAY